MRNSVGFSGARPWLQAGHFGPRSPSHWQHGRCSSECEHVLAPYCQQTSSKKASSEQGPTWVSQKSKLSCPLDPTVAPPTYPPAPAIQGALPSCGRNICTKIAGSPRGKKGLVLRILNSEPQSHWPHRHTGQRHTETHRNTETDRTGRAQQTEQTGQKGQPDKQGCVML